MTQWRSDIHSKLIKLQNDKDRLRNFHFYLRANNHISDMDSDIFDSVMEIINMEMERLKFELILDDILSSDLPLAEFLEKYKEGH